MTSSDGNWQPTQLIDTHIQPSEVHIWLAHLALPAERMQRLASLLSAEESAKAARFHFAHDREHFIVSHAILRLLLARYCTLAPENVHFTVNAYGKPALQTSSDQPLLSFNLSHSHGLALYAFTGICELGIDIEYMRTNLEYTEVATHFFSQREIADLRSLPKEHTASGFFTAWTRKEAYIKARGLGLSLPLDQFDVSLHPEAPAALLEIREPGLDAATWSMHEIPVPAGYKAALALPARNITLRYSDWDDTFI